MNDRELAVLVAGVELRPSGTTKRPVRFVCVPTVQGATNQMKGRWFDLVIVQANFAREDTLEWVERLRTAKPFLPIVVLLGCEQGRQLVEGRLRRAGVTAVLSGDSSKELQKWLDGWVARH